MKKQLLFTLSLLTAIVGADAQEWKTTAERYIADGEFAKAEWMLKALPQAEKDARALQIDSLRAIIKRIRKDFSITPAEGKLRIEEIYGHEVTDKQIERWKLDKLIEYMNIDGQEWWFRRGIGNFKLLNHAEFEVRDQASRDAEAASLRKYYDEAMATKADKNGVRNWHRNNITMTIDVKPDMVPAGEVVRVWMPVPYENLRQKNIKLLSSSHPATMSQGSVHHTVYMEAVAEKGKPTHFEINYTYDVGERNLTQEYLLKHVKPYDTGKEVYRRYTASEAPHQVVTPAMKALALDIVGNEKNPVLQASKIYDWISANFKWAGAREYSTIPNIPEYVLHIGHGDCGQVSLLYITLCRAIGVPARWESGWMLHPGEVNLHDWSETYFEGIGWVPTDQSFGRSTLATSLHDYYKAGMDIYRMAANEGIGGEFSPKKTFIRSETVDSQAGEVEWRGGNLEYGQFSYDLTINSSEPIK